MKDSSKSNNDGCTSSNSKKREEEVVVNTTTTRVVTVSAPGKILVSGGYLVLDPSNAGLVLAVDKRFYVTAKGTFLDHPQRDHNTSPYTDNDNVCEDNNHNDNDKSSKNHDHWISIRVVSPQFGEEYAFRYDTTTCQLLHQKAQTCSGTCAGTSATSTNHQEEEDVHDTSLVLTRNEFVEKTLQVCLLYYTTSSSCLLSQLSSIHLKIQGDNEFWSHPTPSPYVQVPESRSSNNGNLNGNRNDTNNYTKKEKKQLFLPAPRDAATGKICKTGLGSSACLVTSLVAALDHLLLVVVPEQEKEAQQQQQQKEQQQPVSRSEHQQQDVPVDSACTNTTEPELDASTKSATSMGPTKRLERICNLAQLCHCAAQGKMGSGFDVSAACWGSHVYQKQQQTQSQQQQQKLEQVLASLSVSSSSSLASWKNDSSGIRNSNDDEEGTSSSPRQLLKQMVDEPWTQACILHPLFQDHKLYMTTATSTANAGGGILQVLLADTAHGGSSSPSMSKLVLQQHHPKGGPYSVTWNELARINRRIIDVWLFIQKETATTTSQEELQFLASTVASEWNNWSTSPTTTATTSSGICISRSDCTGQNQNQNHSSSQNPDPDSDSPPSLSNLLYQLHCLFLEYRRSFKALGVQTSTHAATCGCAHVELEPEVQTRLADATQQLPGVVAAVVPGAGGYDALACIYVNYTDKKNNERSVRERVCDFWRSQSSSSQEKQQVGGGGGRLLRVTPLNVHAVSYGEGVRLKSCSSSSSSANAKNNQE